MACSDFIADFLTIIRNASRAKKDKVTLKSSKPTARIAEILKEEGFIRNVKPFEENKINYLRVELKYLPDGTPAIQGLKRFSRPGLRQYKGVEDIPKVQGGLGVFIVSTSKGIVTDRAAREQRVGGELMCQVW